MNEYRIVTRGEGRHQRYAVQVLRPARKRLWWTVHEQWVFVDQYPYGGRPVRSFIHLRDAIEHMEDLIAKDKYQADGWKVWK